MDVAIVIAIISGIIALINSYFLHNNKVSKATQKKTSAEADEIIFSLKNQTILDLQKQIDELKEEINSLKKQEYIHLTEKIRLEAVILDLTNQNKDLKLSLDNSHKEIQLLTEQINTMRIELNRFKTKHRKNEQSE